MPLSLKELLDWPPEIEALAKATRASAQNHTNTVEFLQGIQKTSTWEGHGGDAARASITMNAAHHDAAAQRLGLGALGMEHAHVEAEALSNKIKAILNYADEKPAVAVNTSTNQVIPPNTDNLTDEAAAQIAAKTADVQAKVAAALAEGNLVDADLARAIGVATGLPEEQIELVTHDVPLAPAALKPGQVRDLGPIAGTGADGGIPGIGAADLGEVVQLPDGRYVAIFGDSFAGDKMGAGTHYPSVAVPVTFDDQGRPHFGAPLTGPDGSPNVLFPPPPQAAGKDTLPAGSIRMRDGTTYMMAAGTNNLNPDGGSWLTQVTNDPSHGWQPIEGSWRAQGAAPTQISGFQAADGNVYIAADSFDRTQGVSMYRVDPAHVTDRSAWQPWTGNGWGTPEQTAAVVSRTPYGELSFREVDGQAVLSGFNQGTGNTEVRVGNDPAKMFSPGVPTTIIAQQSNPNGANFLPQNYGGYILPNSTLDKLNLFVSQWNTAANTPYDTHEFQVNPKR